MKISIFPKAQATQELQVDVAISKQGVSFTETLTSLYGG